MQTRRAQKRAAKTRLAELRRTEARTAALRYEVPVNVANLAPDNSYSTPDFVTRGFYVDRPFDCKACAKPQVWTATQQKWWYETAKGNVWTVAVLCKPCRQKERERKAEARRVHLDGLASKQREEANG